MTDWARGRRKVIRQPAELHSRQVRLCGTHALIVFTCPGGSRGLHAPAAPVVDTDEDRGDIFGGDAVQVQDLLAAYLTATVA